MSRARSRVESLLASAVRCKDEERKAAVDKAAESFAALDEKRKAKVVSFMEKRLRRDSQNTFDHPEKICDIIALSSFLSEISRQLPVDDNKNKVTGLFEKIILRLETIADSTIRFDQSSDEHKETRLSCTKALWDLDYGHTPFWVGRMKDDVTSEFTVRMLLEMPMTKDPQMHGWTLLRMHLKDMGQVIVANPSHKLADFMIEMLMHGDPATNRFAFNALSNLDIIPAIYVRMARDMVKEGRGDDAPGRFLGSLNKRRKEAKSAHKKEAGSGRPGQLTGAELDMQLLLTVLECADDRQFGAAMTLLLRYHMGRETLRVLIPEIAKEMLEIIEEPAGAGPEERLQQQAKASEVLRAIQGSGFTITKG